MSNPVRVLGIDPGSQVLGWGVVDWKAPQSITFVDSGALRVRSTEGKNGRLMEIHSRIKEVLCRAKPACIVIEEVFYGRNFQSALKIGEARGVCLLAAAQLRIETYSYSASEIKRSVTGNGRAHKSQVQAMVAHILRLNSVPRPADAADALACAICHSNRLNVGL